jgi:thioredoxin reductase (NADPH)
VFAAGDVRHRSVKRVASAVGEGAIAIQLLHEYLLGARQRPSFRNASEELIARANPRDTAKS